MRREYKDEFEVPADILPVAIQNQDGHEYIKRQKEFCIEACFACVVRDFQTHDFGRLEIRWKWREEPSGIFGQGRRFTINFTAQTLTTD